MIRIGICDDEKIICNEIESMLLDYEKETDNSINIDVFYSGEGICDCIKKGMVFDIIFLDIELEKMNGVQVGNIIRREIKNEITQIVYFSWKHEYAMELFQNRPFDFIIKPVSQEKISSIMNKYIKLHIDNKIFFEFDFRKSKYRLRFGEIIYFESHNRKIKIKGTFGENEYYEKLTNVMEMLPDKDFIQIHKSIIVNYLYVAKYSYEEVALSNGEILPISQKFRSEVRAKLLKRKD
ncbi:MAG: LytTR family DNA-binding domain-containing protein [Proteocatella sp.]